MEPDQNAYLETIGALLKRGRAAEVAAFFHSATNADETINFVSYMDQLIARSHMSRAKIAAQVGLSKDYMYKVLRGDKRTTERDYILAICLSMGTNLLETQKVLALYPFPELDPGDLRSAIIMTAFNEGIDRYTLDDWLEQMNQPLLRISPDMPSAKVGPARSTVFRQTLVNLKADEEQESSTRRRFITMEKTNTFVVAEHFGNAPFDYFYLAEFELTGDSGKKVYAQACYWPDGTTVYGIVTKSAQEPMDPCGKQEKPLEEYPTLEDASVSKYFPYFLELDKLTDQKAAETMAAVNDTKTYGFRMNGTLTKAGLVLFAEAYNSQQPELNEYIQVVQSPEGNIYTASHKSYFMQMMLGRDDGGFYEAYFGKAEKPLYLFEITSLDDLGEYEYFRSAYEQMLEKMNSRRSQMEGRKDKED